MQFNLQKAKVTCVTNQDSSPELPPVEDDPGIGDSRRPLLRAARGGAIALAVITVLSLALWGAVRDLSGLYGALIGAAIGGGFMLVTVFIVLASAKTSPQMTMGLILGSWVAKAAILLVVLLALKDKTFYDATALGVTVILVLVAILATETLAVTRTNLMYIPEK